MTRLLLFVNPSFRQTVGPASHPPEVVLAADAAPPSRCFKFEGSGNVAIRFSRPVRIAHVALEKPPPEALLAPKSMPRRFSVFAWRASEGSRPYGELVGEFQYELEGPRNQVFTLGSASSEKMHLAQALKFVLHDNWGEDFTSVCRLRAFGGGDE